ncbi:MAG: FG-GAP repeat domain-containing protein, partial [Gemmatimonadota bacterium]
MTRTCSIGRNRRAVALLALAAGIAACERDTPVEPPPDPPGTPSGVLGVVEVTFRGIGTDAMSASARSAPTVAALERLRAGDADGGGLQPQSLDPPANDDDTGDGTIQIEPLATGSFTDGERGAGGERYMFATYRVRNAESDGTAYDTDRTNLTFLAVDTDGTIDVTAVSRLERFDGSAAATSIASELMPTGAVVKDPTDNTIAAAAPDVLQALTEAEAAAVTAPADVDDVFPYGFVVRNPNDPSSRTLPASPAADQFDGLVTFAFRVPLQATSSDDPFTISAIFLATDDSETRLTQSLEEQTPAGRSAIETRAAALGATTVSLLPEGSYLGTAATARTLCSVRTAGTAATPDAFLVDVPEFVSLAPDPYATDGSGSAIASPTDFDATFDAAADGADHTTFAVHGFQQGRLFVGQGYSGNGTTTVTSPSGTLFPGATVEVTLTHPLGCPDRVARYRVASAAASAAFTEPAASPFAVGDKPVSVALGDLDGDGVLDLAAANEFTDDVSIRLGNGDGSFQAQQTFAVGDAPQSVALGDLDGDGV